MIALAFGLLAIGAVLWFLFRDRNRSFEALARSETAGEVTVNDEPALEHMAALAALDLGANPPFSIVGPAAIATNSPIGYLARNAPGDAISWTVEGDGTVFPSSGLHTKLTASAPGGLVLVATSNNQTAQLPITAAAPQRLSTVPFLGAGYGSVVIALSVASVTAALGLTNIINGQAVAGILGSLVTYSVVRSTGSGPASGMPTPTGTAQKSA